LKAVRPKNDNKTECTEKGYKPCGSGDSSHEICVLSSNDCPIDGLAINKQSKFGNYTPVPLSGGYYLHFTSNTSALPIVDFTITEGQVCIFNDEYDKPKGKVIYPLLKTWKYNGCEGRIGDLRYDNATRWSNVISRNELDLYNDNPDLIKKIGLLPGYKITDSQYSLYIRPYIDWTLKCQTSKEADMNKIAEDNNPINTLANVQLIYCIIT